MPRARGLHDIHRVQVKGGLFFGLTARQELRGDACQLHCSSLLHSTTYHNARDSGGDSALQSAESVRSNLVRGGLLGAVLAGADHGGLEQGTLQQDVVVVQGLVHCSQDTFGVVRADLSKK